VTHLSPDQMSECILGPPGTDAARHLEECPACRAELGNLREALGEFRGAVRYWSAREAHSALAAPVRTEESRSWIAPHQFALALLLAAVFLLASIAVPWYERRQSIAASDAALLNQVDTQVSRTAPASLEPLMKLVVERRR
jgi:anti-sigma factor RsiW